MGKHILDGVYGFVKRSEYFMVDPRSIIVDNGWNGRIDFSGEAELMESIIHEGVKVPIEVRKGDDNALHLVDGERRLRATLRAIHDGHDIKAIPAIVAPKGMNEADLLFDAVIRNTGKPHTPIEEAGLFKRFINWGYTESQIASRVGKSIQHIRNRLTLNNASPSIRDDLASGKITITEATEISKEPSIDRQAEKASSAGKPHARKNIVIKYKSGDVIYTGAGKGITLQKIEDMLFDDDLWHEIESLGFDPASIRIQIKPKV